MSKSNRKNASEVTVLVPNVEGELVAITPENSAELAQLIADGDISNEGVAEVMAEAVKTQAKAKGKRGKKELDMNDPFMKQTIQLCRVDNPKRKGSKSAKRFELYQNGMTVGEFIKAGGTRGDVNWDTAHEHIELQPAPKAVAAE